MLDLAIAPRFDISVADIDDNLFSKDFRLTSELCSSWNFFFFFFIILSESFVNFHIDGILILYRIVLVAIKLQLDMPSKWFI